MHIQYIAKSCLKTEVDIKTVKGEDPSPALARFKIQRGHMVGNIGLNPIKEAKGGTRFCRPEANTIWGLFWGGGII